MEKLWKTIRSESLLKTSVFEVSKEECELPDGRIMPAYFRLTCGDWVNVVPFTKEGKVLLLRQYRHGSGKWHWEIPGGAMSRSSDGGANRETPIVAAQRELLEETGFESSRWESAGVHWPNPALQANQIHTFIAYDCVRVGELNLDPYEDLTVHELSVDEIKELVRKKEINHSLILAALAFGFFKI